MLGVSVTVMVTLAALAVPESSTAARSLTAARSIALTLREDSADVNAAAGASRGAGLTSRQKEKIRNDVSTGRETTRELWQVDKLATPSQDALIIEVAPLLLELTQNTEMMFDRLPGGWHALDPADTGNYFPAHVEISKQLASQIVEAIDKCTDCGLPRRPGS